MPPISERQRRAMRAAEAGRSTLGIPQSVGKDFSEADQGGALPEAAPKAQRHPGGGRGVRALFRPRPSAGKKGK